MPSPTLAAFCSCLVVCALYSIYLWHPSLLNTISVVFGSGGGGVLSFTSCFCCYKSASTLLLTVYGTVKQMVVFPTSFIICVDEQLKSFSRFRLNVKRHCLFIFSVLFTGPEINLNIMWSLFPWLFLRNSFTAICGWTSHTFLLCREVGHRWVNNTFHFISSLENMWFLRNLGLTAFSCS